MPAHDDVGGVESKKVKDVNFVLLAVAPCPAIYLGTDMRSPIDILKYKYKLNDCSK